MKNQSGIYKIQSKIKPERIYIGSSLDITHRWREHFKHLIDNKHHSKKLQYHVNKYGIDDLQFSIIEPCFSDWMINREQFYISKLKPYFNICKIAGSSLGRKLSGETRKKIGKANSNPSEKTRQKMREFAKNRIYSKETREKMSRAHKGNKNNLGRKMSDMHRERTRIASTGRPNKYKGTHGRFSKETLAKMSIASKGRPGPWKGKKMPEELREKMSQSHKGFKHTEESKQKMRKPRSSEVKERCRLSALKTWELRKLKNKIEQQEASLCN